MISLSSCFHNFYRTNTTRSIDVNTASRLQSENKYFIIHFANSTNGIEGVHIKGDSLYGKIVSLPAEHSGNLNPIPTDRSNKIKEGTKAAALVEVHLYTNATLNNPDSLFGISLSFFTRVDVYELDRERTASNHFASTIGVVFLGGLLVGLALVVIIGSGQAF